MTEGAFQVISDQILTLIQLKHQVEVVIVREDRASVFEKMRKIGWDANRKDFKLIFFENEAPAETRAQPRPKITAKWGRKSGAEFRRRAHLEDTSEEAHSDETPKAQPDHRWRRVFFSLFSRLASPELLYYPPQHDHRDMLGAVDLAIYHYSFAYAWLIHPIAPQEAKKVVYFHNLESDLFRQRAQNTQGAKGAKNAPSIIHKLIFYLNAWKLESHEKKLSQLCDEVWLISPPDQKQYLQRNPTAVTRLVPPSFHSQLKTARTKRFIQNQKSKPQTGVTLGYLGGMDFGPNRDSAFWILSRLAPELLKKNFTGRILIAGKNPPPEILQLAQCFPFVEILGFLEDTEDFWSSLSWMLVPHLTGSGVRMKLLEALASGVPVLAHPSAIERLHPALHHHSGVVACASVADWTQKILAERPFQTRLKLQVHSEKNDTIVGLSGVDIYRFLK